MNSAPNIGLLPLQLIYVNQGRWKPLNCGCAAYLVDQDFSGQNLSLNKERSQKSGCAAAHSAHPVPAPDSRAYFIDAGKVCCFFNHISFSNTFHPSLFISRLSSLPVYKEHFTPPCLFNFKDFSTLPYL